MNENKHRRVTNRIGETCPIAERPVLDLPTPEGSKAELTLVVGYIY